jgi:hypothetical protein
MIPVITMDFRAIAPWQEVYRQSCQQAQELASKTERRAVLVIDHCGDVEPSDIKAAYNELTKASPGIFYALLWVGCIDCKQPDIVDALPPIRNLKTSALMPEYHRDDLLRIYRTIGRNQECNWGEAILFFLHDWCGSELELVKGVSAYFYGDWRDRLYDESVTECLDRWLMADPGVDSYRNKLKEMEGTAKDHLRLLCKGGKVLCHAPAIEHETDDVLRELFFAGIVTPNLIPGFYQFRNLTVKLLAMQEHVGTQVTSVAMLRGSSNARIHMLLQDVELSLRYLLTHCFLQIGFDEVRALLDKTRTDEMPISPEVRKLLSVWAEQTGGEDLKQKLGTLLSEYTTDFLRSHSLYARITGLFSAESGIDDDTPGEPTLERIVDYLTFSELSHLVQRLCPEILPLWTRETMGRQSPAKRWPAYLARLQRIRNQTAHLRNVTFQDMEDLLTTLREIRKDMKDYV